jgi:hypothetical protein
MSYCPAQVEVQFALGERGEERMAWGHISALHSFASFISYALLGSLILPFGLRHGKKDGSPALNASEMNFASHEATGCQK